MMIIKNLFYHSLMKIGGKRISLLFTIRPNASLTLQCIEDTATYGLSYDDYTTLLGKYNLSAYFLDKSIKGHIASQNRILSLLKHSPKERYEQFLQLYPSLLQKFKISFILISWRFERNLKSIV